MQGLCRQRHQLQRVVGRHHGAHGLAFEILGQLLAVAVGEDVDRHLAAEALLAAQFLGGHRGERRHRGVYLLVLGQLVREAARDGDLLFGRRGALEVDARLALKLFPCAQPRDPHAAAYPCLGTLHEVPCRTYVGGLQHAPVLAPDAPDILYREFAQYLFDVLRTVHQAGALQLGVLLAEFRRDLGQRFGRGDADAHGDARIAAYRAADVPSQLLQSSGFDAPQVEERLVDGVYLGGGNHAAERPDHAPRHVAVEVEITRKDGYIMPFFEVADLEIGVSHADAERLGLVRARDHAAVVVRQHDDGPPLQFGAEDPLARGEEIIAVAKSVHRFFVLHVVRPPPLGRCGSLAGILLGVK